jgi:hypothetical protein
MFTTDGAVSNFMFFAHIDQLIGLAFIFPSVQFAWANLFHAVEFERSNIVLSNEILGIKKAIGTDQWLSYLEINFYPFILATISSGK